MKTRTGFVSNSSSSSFIIGVGVVEDLDAVKQWAPDFPKLPNDIDSDVHVLQIKDVIQDSRASEADCKFHTDELGNKTLKVLSLESFMYTDVAIGDLEDLDTDTYIIVYYGGCSLDECDFYSYDEEEDEYGDEPDYDVDLDQFSDSEQKAYDVFDAPGVRGDVHYGAGRNG